MQKAKKIHVIIFGLLAAALLYFYLTNPLPTISYLMEDMLCQHATTPQKNIYIIGVDDKSLQALGPWNTWPRSRMAEMISLLNADEDKRPAVIGIDFMYFGEGNGDEALFQAASRYDNLVFASELKFNTTLQILADDGSYRMDSLLPRAVELPQAPLDTLSGHGFTNVFLDSDGKVRRSMYTAECDGIQYDNFAYKIYQTYAEASGLPLYVPDVDKNGLWSFPYSVKPGVYAQGVSFLDVLQGHIPASFFKDGIVLIGAYASGMTDSYYTPISYSEPMFGVEINASMVQALCEGKSLRPVPVWLQLILFPMLLFVCFYLYQKDTLWKNFCLFTSTAGYLLAAALLARAGLIINCLYFPLFSGLLYLAEIILSYLDERRERLLTLETFGRYVSPDVASHLLSSIGSPMEAMRESRRHIAVMFVDIRGFTPLSESLAPEEIAGILNEYFTLTTTAVFENKGMIDKFIGDATMALFNAPGDLKDYVYQAVKASVQIRDGSEALRQIIKERYAREIHLGIGIHCGDAVVGSIGTTYRMDYTAIGDTVNTASRLESNAAPDQILISEEVCHVLAGRIRTEYLGEKQLKGKQKPVPLYAVLSLEETESNP